jgi:hypothetical protein
MESNDWKHGELPYYQRDCLGVKEVGVNGENYHIIVDEFTGLARIEKVEDNNNARK